MDPAVYDYRTGPGVSLYVIARPVSCRREYI